MRKNTRKKNIREENVLTEIICYRCGRTYRNNEEEAKFHDAVIHQLKLLFGNSRNFETESWSFDLCEDCLLDIIKILKPVPVGFMQPEGWILEKAIRQSLKVGKRQVSGKLSWDGQMMMKN